MKKSAAKKPTAKKTKPNYWMYIGIVSIVINLILPIYILKQARAETLLYVQDAQTALLQKKDDTTFILTMQNAPETLFFSDRPYRRAGSLPSTQFVDILNEDRKNPPNAILQVHMNGAIRNMPVELLKGMADMQNLTMVYTVKPLPIDKNQDYMDIYGLGSEVQFTGAVLFIDAFPTAVNDQITD